MTATVTADRRPSWCTLGLVAVLVAYADGFWITSLQGAIGAIERAQEPFGRWLRDGTIMVPVMALAVWIALRLAQRWSTRFRSRAAHLAAALLLVVTVTTMVAVAEAGASSVYDYRLQRPRIDAMHGDHQHLGAGCLGACAARQATIDAHLRGVGYASLVLLATNAVLVGWAATLRGGRLWSPARMPYGSIASVAGSALHAADAGVPS